MKKLISAVVLSIFFVGLSSNITQAQDTYQQALKAYGQRNYDKVISLCEQLLEEDQSDDAQVKAYTFLGIVYFEKKELNQALLNYNKALPIAKKINKPIFLAKIHSNVGVAYTWLGDYSKAKNSLSIAFRYPSDKQTEGNIFNNFGIIYRRENKFDSAYYYYQKALPLVTINIKHTVLNDLGLLFQYQAQYDSAAHYFSRAYEIRKKKYSSYHSLTARTANHIAYNLRKEGKYTWAELILSQNHNPKVDSMERLRSFILHGDLLKSQGEYKEALVMYDQANQLALPIRKGMQQKEDKEYFVQVTGKLYDIALELSLALGDYEKAFYFSERNKGSILLETTQARNSLGYSPLIGAKEIRAKLNKNQAVLSYALFGDSLAIFVLTKDKLAVHRQAKDSLELECRRFNAYLEMFLGDHHYIPYARRLYDRMFAPIAELVKDQKELLIIPQGKLFTPFEAFLRSKPDTSAPTIFWNYKEFPLLIHDYTISYHFSASLAFLPRPERTYHLDYVGIAPSYGGNYRELPQSILEIQGVKTRVDQRGQSSKIYVGDDATKGKMKDLKTKTFHIATHYHNNGLVMRDGSLTLKELYAENYKIETELAVLSGCQTFGGKFVAGEGPVNLVSHFIEAGAENVVFSFNRVFDGPGQRFIESFFQQYLEKGLNYAEALRAAKLEMLSHPNYNHFVYWSGMGLINSEFAKVK